MARVCIICGNEVKTGSAVADDLVIRSIRRAKQALHIAKNNELVVCKDDLEAYMKKRQGYERNLAVYMVIAGLVFVLLVAVPLFTTGFSAYSLVLGALLAALLVVLPVVTSHTPALVGAASPQAGGASRPQPAQRAPAGKKANAAPKGKKKGKR
jgi:hypothetical protein